MDEFLDKVDVWLNTAIDFAKAMTIEEWAMVAAGLIIFLSLRWLIKRAKRPRNPSAKRQAVSTAPGVKLYTFQIAPLGRDAFLKIQNTGEEVTLTKLEIKDRQNIIVKNALAGHKLDTNKVYGILLEAEGNSKITDGFSVQLTYLTKLGKVLSTQFNAFQTKKD
jgi:hypothetical protein